MSERIDETPDPNLDRVARIATEIADKIRDDDPRHLFDELAALCRWHPAKAAQLIMTYAAWFDPEVSTQTLWQRVRSITDARAAVA